MAAKLAAKLHCLKLRNAFAQAHDKRQSWWHLFSLEIVTNFYVLPVSFS